MKVIKFKEFLERSSARCFIADCDDGNKWVIRCKKKVFHSKPLFSEYVAGIIADELGINHPKVSLVNIPIEILEKINKNEHIFDTKCTVGVATIFIKDLEEILDPENNDPKEAMVSKNFNNADQMYGYIFFVFWLFIDDLFKPDNLQKTPDNKIVFLDFDFAFKSNDGDWGLPSYANYNYTIATYRPPFFEPFMSDINYYESWFIKLQGLSKKKVIEKIGELPLCWEVPSNYLKPLLNYLFDNRNLFIEKFENGIHLGKNLDNSNNPKFFQ